MKIAETVYGNTKYSAGVRLDFRYNKNRAHFTLCVQRMCNMKSEMLPAFQAAILFGDIDVRQYN